MEYLIENGTLFQSFEGATANSQSPLSLSLDWGTARSILSEDLRDLVLEKGQRSFEM